MAFCVPVMSGAAPVCICVTAAQPLASVSTAFAGSPEG
jgi:hypothetical protein